jgi:hypothetical protein
LGDRDRITLGDWPKHGLSVRCGTCRGLVVIPIQLLIKRGVSRDMPIVTAIEKTKCTRWNDRLERPCGGQVG